MKPRDCWNSKARSDRRFRSIVLALSVMPFVMPFVILGSIGIGADPVSPPPLSSEQLDQVRSLVKRTQSEQTRLKSALSVSQEKLAECYTDYDLDEKQVSKLQQEIVELQRQLLATHHTMQVELRSIVGAERFKILSRRIANALKSPVQSSSSE